MKINAKYMVKIQLDRHCAYIDEGNIMQYHIIYNINNCFLAT